MILSYEENLEKLCIFADICEESDNGSGEICREDYLACPLYRIKLMKDMKYWRSDYQDIKDG